MAEQVLIPFEIKDGKLDEAKAVIKEFMEEVRSMEPKTLFYSSFQIQNNPNQFVHFMIFADSEAHQQHRGSVYVDDFVSSLYPLCVREPEAVVLEEFDSCGVVALALG